MHFRTGAPVLRLMTSHKMGMLAGEGCLDLSYMYLFQILHLLGSCQRVTQSLAPLLEESYRPGCSMSQDADGALPGCRSLPVTKHKISSVLTLLLLMQSPHLKEQQHKIWKTGMSEP